MRYCCSIADALSPMHYCTAAVTAIDRQHWRAGAALLIVAAMLRLHYDALLLLDYDVLLHVAL